jgi:molybdopterin-guanine dinucleotide biosynthesis protein A
VTTSRGNAPVKGLVLAGGRSTRMGVDKCALELHGAPQARYCIDLLQQFLPETWVSARTDQRGLPSLAALPLLEDRYEGIGPVSGVLSAMEAQPEAAWLVLACDLPLADARGVRALLDGRDPERLGTAYMASDGFFEPLFAIYEPAMQPWLRERLGRGRYGLREALADADVRLLCPPDEQTLINVNTPEDLERVRRAIASAQVRA